MYWKIMSVVMLILFGVTFMKQEEVQAEKQVVEYSTIIIRTFVDRNGNEIFDTADDELDNIRVCLTSSDGTTQCGLTGDSEYEYDSRVSGVYTGTADLEQEGLAGYELKSQRCSEHPVTPRDDVCDYKEPGLITVNLPAEEAIIINFNFQEPESAPTPTNTPAPTGTAEATITATPSPTASAQPRLSGYSTIIIRTFIDRNGNEIFDTEDDELDNIWVCLTNSDGEEHCGLTEDSEYEYDRVADVYTGTVDLEQEGLANYDLNSQRCSEHPVTPRDDVCEYKEPGVVAVNLPGSESIVINFNFQESGSASTPTSTPTATPTVPPGSTRTLPPTPTPSSTAPWEVYNLHLPLLIR